MRSGPDRNPALVCTSCCLDFGLLYVIGHVENSGYGGFHPTGLVNAGLGLKVAGGLEFKTFIRASRDTGAAAEGLFKTGTKPVEVNHR